MNKGFCWEPAQFILEGCSTSGATITPLVDPTGISTTNYYPHTPQRYAEQPPLTVPKVVASYSNSAVPEKNALAQLHKPGNFSKKIARESNPQSVEKFFREVYFPEVNKDNLYGKVPESHSMQQRVESIFYGQLLPQILPSAMAATIIKNQSELNLSDRTLTLIYPNLKESNIALIKALYNSEPNLDQEEFISSTEVATYQAFGKMPYHHNSTIQHYLPDLSDGIDLRQAIDFLLDNNFDHEEIWHIVKALARFKMDINTIKLSNLQDAEKLLLRQTINDRFFEIIFYLHNTIRLTELMLNSCEYISDKFDYFKRIPQFVYKPFLLTQMLFRGPYRFDYLNRTDIYLDRIGMHNSFFPSLLTWTMGAKNHNTFINYYRFVRSAKEIYAYVEEGDFPSMARMAIEKIAIASTFRMGCFFEIKPSSNPTYSFCYMNDPEIFEEASKVCHYIFEINRGSRSYPIRMKPEQIAEVMKVVQEEYVERLVMFPGAMRTALG